MNEYLKIAFSTTVILFTLEAVSQNPPLLTSPKASISSREPEVSSPADSSKNKDKNGITTKKPKEKSSDSQDNMPAKTTKKPPSSKDKKMASKKMKEKSSENPTPDKTNDMTTKNPTPEKSNGSIEAKDEVLKELQLFTQGVETLGHSVSDNNENSPPKEDSSLDIPSLEKMYKEHGNSKDYVSKIRVLNLLIAKKPKNMEYHFDRILAQKALEYDPFPNQLKMNEIVKSLQTIINSDPQFEKAYWAMFDIIHHYNKWTEGTEFFNDENILFSLNLIKDITKNFGENQKTVQYLCHYMMANNYYNEAQAECLKFKKMNPENPESYLYTDYFFSDKKEQALLGILKKFPNSEKVLTHVAQMFFEKKNFDLSLKYFKKALKVNPDYFPALLGAGETLFKLDKVQEALVYYLKACKKNKFKAKTPFQKAKAYLSQKSLFREANEYQNHINFCLN